MHVLVHRSDHYNRSGIVFDQRYCVACTGIFIIDYSKCKTGPYAGQSIAIIYQRFLFQTCRVINGDGHRLRCWTRNNMATNLMSGHMAYSCGSYTLVEKCHILTGDLQVTQTHMRAVFLHMK